MAAVAVARQRVLMPSGSFRVAIASWAKGALWEGDDVGRFERAFAAFIGVAEAVAVPSGRAGLRFILEALELPPGAGVICPAFGYPVVPHLVRALGFDLKLVDCEAQTLGMDPAALGPDVSGRTGAVIAAHLYGMPCRIREIAEIAAASGALLIEDCAHCCGASAGGRRAGSFGRVAYFSFETSKMINTMGGGMITTDDRELAERIRRISSAEPRKGTRWLAGRLLRTGLEATMTSPLPFNVAAYPALRLLSRNGQARDRFASGFGDEISMQGRLGRYTNYQARLGLAQLSTIGPRIARRVENARRLIERLRGRVRFQEPASADVEPNYMLVAALFPRMPETAARLLAAGVDTKHHYMRDCSGLLDDGASFPVAARLEREVLHLPAYPELRPAAIDKIARTVADVGLREPFSAAEKGSRSPRTRR